jgi:putative nucleotidyltransferase with HDIG domain
LRSRLCYGRGSVAVELDSSAMDWSVLEPMLREVDAKDASTASHTARVALYTQALAEDRGLDEATVQRFMQAALLHDIGKVDIPGEILAKPGPLTDAEFAVMRTHTVRGHERLLAASVTDPIVLELVRSHHERLDGSGYPDALVGAAIPRSAAWFSIIDTFDAMTSKRPYRSDTGPAAAERSIAELERKAGAWYDPDAVQAFVRLYRSGQLDWILHHLNDDSPPERTPQFVEELVPNRMLGLRASVRGK